MDESSPRVNLPEQLNLLGDQAYELTLRVGLIPLADHMQLAIEIREVKSAALIHLESRPHISAYDHAEHLDEWFGKLRGLIAELSSPF